MVLLFLHSYFNVIYKILFLTVSNNPPDENTNSVFCHMLFAFRADTTSPIPSSMAVIMAAIVGNI